MKRLYNWVFYIHQFVQTPILALITITVIGGITFFPALDNEFIHWDDQFYITNNPLISYPTTNSIEQLFREVISLNYHPVTMLSLWATALVFGSSKAFPFILGNIIIHLLASWICFIFSYRLSKENVQVALFTSLCFCLHPMHVESVVWVSERKDVLYGLFFLLSCLAYLRYLRQGSILFLVLTYVLFAVSCLSKAMAVSLVGVLFLIDYIELRKFELKNFIIKVPFILTALLIGLIAIDVQSGGDYHGLLSNLSFEQAIARDQAFNIIQKLCIASYGLCFYLLKFFVPSGHSVFHPYDFELIYNPFFYAYLLLPLGLLVLLIIYRNNTILFGISFFIFTIALVLQYLPVGSAIVAERYTYLPYIGLAYVVGYKVQLLDRLHKWVPLLFLITSSCLMSYLSRNQSDHWQNHTTLFSQVVAQYPSSPLARKYLATGYWIDGLTDLSIKEIKFATDTLEYEDSSLFDILANCYADKKDAKNALYYFDKAIILNPNNYKSHYHRGLLLMEFDPNAAIEDFNLCENSNDLYVRPLIYSPRARCHGMTGQLDLAIKDFTQAINLKTDLIPNYFDRAKTYELMQEYELALADYYQVQSLDPNWAGLDDSIERVNSSLDL